MARPATQAGMTQALSSRGESERSRASEGPTACPAVVDAANPSESEG